MDRLLLLIPTTSYRVGDFLEAAHRLEISVAVGSNRRQVLEKYSNGSTVTLDFANVDMGVKQIMAHAGTYPLKAIVATDEETTVLAAAASEALGLTHNLAQSVAITGNKHRLRTRLFEAGLRSPGFLRISVDDDPVHAAREAVYPCVLKPLALSASRGVIRVDNSAAFIAAFHRIVAILAQANDPARSDTANFILVEDYIPGVEIALEGLLVSGRLNVLALFDKPDPLIGPFFEETIYVTPSRLATSAQDEIIAATSQALAAVGLHDGPIHAELRINKAGPWIIDLAARSIGGLCSRALKFGAGISLEELILRHALGLPISCTERESRAAGVMMIPIPRAGTLRDARGIEAARSVPGIEDVTISIPIGQELVPLPEGYKYLGFIFARAADPEAVETILRKAHRRLEFAIEPEKEA